MLLVLLESPSWVEIFNEGDLNFFRPTVQKILKIWVIFVIENLIKLQKWFWKEKLVR
jgi:hypothetical protein